MVMVSPEIYLASSLHRNTQVRPMSFSESPNRPAGMPEMVLA